MKTVYFDHAATTPVDPLVLEAMLPYFSEHYGNPSELHRLGREARAAVEAARAQVAAVLGAGESIPAPFLERILARLREAGLVKATRGVSGGYQLARAAGDVAVGDVVTALEGPLSLVGCVPDDGACARAEHLRLRRRREHSGKRFG